MPSRLATLIAGLLVTLAHTAAAQEAFSIPAKTSLHFESWQPALDYSSIPSAGSSTITVARDKKDTWLIAGAAGAAAGIIFCTAMSTAMNDSASGGLSFCPLGSYAVMAGGGFVLGATIGLAF